MINVKPIKFNFTATVTSNASVQGPLSVAACSLLLERPPKWGDATRYLAKEHHRLAGRATFQGQVYNFLERPNSWKCFVYHFVV